MRCLAAIGCAVLLGGCGLVSFDVTESIPAQTIPGQSQAAGAPASVFETTFALSSKDLPDGSGAVDSVTLSSVHMHTVAPAGATFDFVDSVTLSISSPTKPALPARMIATGRSKPGQPEVVLSPTGGVDLLPYVKAGAVISAAGTGRPPPETTTFAGTAVLTIHL